MDVVEISERLSLGVGFRGQQAVGVVGVRDRAIFRVDGAQQETRRRAGAGGDVIKGAGLGVGAARHADGDEVIQDVVGVVGADLAEGRDRSRRPW